MSTKLHHGHRLAEGVDPFAFIATVRTALNPVRDRADARILAEKVVEIIDKAAVHGLPDDPDAPLNDMMSAPLTAAYLAYEDEQAKLGKTDRRHDPNRVELAIGLDQQTGRYGVLLFADCDLLVDAFRAMPQVEEYPYWNNSDRPDEVTETEWVERREFWDRMLPGCAAPAEVMFTWSLRGPYNPGMMSLVANRSPLILEELPSVDRRAHRAAQHAVTDAAARVMPEGSRSLQELTRLVFRTLDSDQYPEVVDAARALLPTDVNFDLLMGVRPLVVEDADTKRAVFAVLAEAAGKRLHQAELEED